MGVNTGEFFVHDESSWMRRAAKTGFHQVLEVTNFNQLKSKSQDKRNQSLAQAAIQKAIKDKNKAAKRSYNSYKSPVADFLKDNNQRQQATPTPQKRGAHNKVDHLRVQFEQLRHDSVGYVPVTNPVAGFVANLFKVVLVVGLLAGIYYALNNKDSIKNQFKDKLTQHSQTLDNL